MKRPERIGDVVLEGSAPGNVYLLRSAINCSYRGPTETLHVMSKSAGGQIRGYERATGSGGVWMVSTPAYEGNWVAMDLAVSDLIGAPVRGLDGITRRQVAA